MTAATTTGLALGAYGALILAGGFPATGDTLESLPGLAAFIAETEPLYEVDGSARDGQSGFEQIEAGELGPEGRLFVLDHRARRVRVFDPDGELVQELGPVSTNADDLAVDGRGRLYVAEQRGRVQVFEPGEESYRFARTFSVSGFPETACAMGERLYLMERRPGETTGSLVQVYTPAGEKVDEFGRRLQVRDGLGEITCFDDRETVVFATGFGGRVEAHTSSGEQLWRTSLPDFRPADVRIVRGGRAMRISGHNSGETDAVTSMAPFLGGTLLVQAHRRSNFVRGKRWHLLDRFRTYGLGVAHGGPVLADEPIPRVLDVALGRMVLVRTEPSLRVLVYDLGR